MAPVEGASAVAFTGQFFERDIGRISRPIPGILFGRFSRTEIVAFERRVSSRTPRLGHVLGWAHFFPALSKADSTKPDPIQRRISDLSIIPVHYSSLSV
jgi:hypothetical protein